MSKVSIVLPAYNEAVKLRKAIESVKKYIGGYEYEIIIAEDGSTDGTDRIAAEIASSDSKIRHLHSDERLGKGKALVEAFRQSDGDILVYLDVDLSTDMQHLRQLIDSIAVEGYSVATGSRLMRESKTERPFKRAIASKVYNFLVRFLLGSKLHDHQCGFKAFKRDALMEMVKHVKDKHWFWDTEVLVLAQRMGYAVKEFPVRWKQSRDTKVRFGRDILYMFSQIIRMWSEGIKSSRKFLVFSIFLAITILLALGLFVGAENVIKNLYLANSGFIGFAALLYSSSFIVRGARYRYIISKLGHKVPLLFSSESIAISQTMNVVTPVRVGDVARAYVFKIRNVPFADSISGLAVERIFDLVAVIVLAFLAIIALSDIKFILTPLYASALLFLLLVVVIAISKMENVVGKILRNAKDLMKTKSSLAILISSAIIWTADIAVCHLILLSFEFNIFPLVVLAVSIANISKVVPLTPGGIGTYEAVMTAILASSIEPGLAFTVALIDHALKNLMTLVLGLVSLASLNIKFRDVIR
jgi:hypothetical protein